MEENVLYWNQKEGCYCMMKIGVSVEPYGKAANLYGEEMFQKLSSFGFSAIDYNITGTRYELYSMDDKAFTQRLSKEKAAADAGLFRISAKFGIIQPTMNLKRMRNSIIVMRIRSLSVTAS